MITNQFISPHPLLKPFVNNYLLSSSNGLHTNFSSHWSASNELSFVFYLGDQSSHTNHHADSIVSGKALCFVSLSTRYNGVIQFEGKYHTFIIQFGLDGVNKIFGLPMVQFTDKIFTIEDVIGKKASALYDQLLHAPDIEQMARHADAFLLSFLNRHTKKLHPQDCIAFISKAFYDTTGIQRVAKYAHMVNMSVKSFERKFNEQSGVLPKLYMRLLRFNEAVKMKTIHPCKSFTSLTSVAILIKCISSKILKNSTI